MADKKVTTLTERSLVVEGADLLMIVGNTATTATNYKVQVKNFLSKLQIDLPSNTETSAVKVTASVVANASVLQSAGLFVLNAGNASIGGTNTYGLIVSHTVANLTSNLVTGTMPVAFLGFQDRQSSNVKTTYLFELGAGSNGSVNTWVTSAATPNNTTLVATANTLRAAPANTVPASHTIRCRINGADYWLLASNVAPA